MNGSLTNVVVAGLGGQGVIKASDIVADAACRTGLEVKKAEIHGMSQRGGSVSTDVRFGRRVLSPMVPEGEADYLVVLAPDQVDNNRHLLKPGGVLIKCDFVNEAELPGKRSLNIAMMGVLSTYLDLPLEAWHAAVRAALPEKVHEANLLAFEIGREKARASKQ